MNISVIIPAHNEQEYIGACLDSIQTAAEALNEDVEIVVVLNRCTDRTEEIARTAGASIVAEESRNLAKIRNAGVQASSGEVVVTIDADSRMSDNMLMEIRQALESRTFVGGGVRVYFERYSIGIRVSYLFLQAYLWLTGLSGGLYWVLRRDFEAVGGFDEHLSFGEDLDFAKRLRRYGRQTGRTFTTLRSASITTSCRKFDRFGDWYIFRLMLFGQRRLRRCMRGEDSSFADEYFYDFNK